MQPNHVPISKTQNNTFNVLQYLNTDCKDAMNLSDMINQLQISLQDLVYLGHNGFIKSVENTFVKKLKNMEQTKRPIHCTDKKRKKVFIKEENKWERDNQHKKLAVAIDAINKKQMSALSKHHNLHPNWNENDKVFILHNKMIQHLCDFTSAEEETCAFKKIMGTITENTMLDKEP